MRLRHPADKRKHAETRLRMAAAQRGKPIWGTCVDRAGPIKLLKRAACGQTAVGWGGRSGPWRKMAATGAALVENRVDRGRSREKPLTGGKRPISWTASWEC